MGGPAIYLFEVAATVLIAYLAAHRCGENPLTCVLRIDYKAALAALLNGEFSSEPEDILVNMFWSLGARFPVVWWFEYANTKPTASGEHSRLCDSRLAGNAIGLWAIYRQRP